MFDTSASISSFSGRSSPGTLNCLGLFINNPLHKEFCSTSLHTFTSENKSKAETVSHAAKSAAWLQTLLPRQLEPKLNLAR